MPSRYQGNQKRSTTLTQKKTKSRGGLPRNKQSLATVLKQKKVIVALLLFAAGGAILLNYSRAAVAPTGAVTGVGDLIWSDEFDGTSLDLKKWEPNWFGGTTDPNKITEPINSQEDTCYDPKNATVNSGTLKLKLEKVTPYTACKRKDGSLANNKSGMVNTRLSKADFKDAYYEARVFMPGTKSYIYNWPAFWTNGQQLNDTWAADGEIDIAEATEHVRWHYHIGNDRLGQHKEYSSSDVTPPMFVNTTSGESGWHTYGLKREANKLTFYYDGVAYGTQTTNVTSSPHYIAFNYGVEDYCNSKNDNGTYCYLYSAPATMEVDYIRVWSLGTSSNQQPTVSLATLNASYVAPATLTLNATASDSDGSIAKVEFFNGSTKIGESTTAPYSYAWSSIPAGSYTVKARATDNLGAVSESAPQSFTVNTTTVSPPPADTTSSVTLGALNTTYASGSNIQLTADAKDPDGIARVSFYNNGDQWLGTDTSAPYEVLMSNVADGSYSIVAKATDNTGQVIYSAPKLFTVSKTTSTDPGNTTIDTQTPTVPTNLRASLVARWSKIKYELVLGWDNSTDNVGVKGYTVYRNGSSIGSTSTNSFTDTASLKSNTVYGYTVKAFDAAGNESAGVTLNVKASCLLFYCTL